MGFLVFHTTLYISGLSGKRLTKGNASAMSTTLATRSAATVALTIEDKARPYWRSMSLRSGRSRRCERKSRRRSSGAAPREIHARVNARESAHIVPLSQPFPKVLRHLGSQRREPHYEGGFACCRRFDKLRI